MSTVADGNADASSFSPWPEIFVSFALIDEMLTFQTLACYLLRWPVHTANSVDNSKFSFTPTPFTHNRSFYRKHSLTLW